MQAQAAKHEREPPTELREHNGNGTGRERVAKIQRARMLAAMAEVVCEHGAANVTVAQVVQRAGVSRRTFYEIFADIDHCLVTAVEESQARAARRVVEVYDATAPWLDRIRTALAALLAFLDEERSMGRLLIVESLAAGPEALRRRQDMLAPLIATIDEGRAQARKGAEPPPLTAEGVVGGVLGVLHARLSEQAPGRLTDLAGSLAAMIVLPYLGAAAAKRELARPVQPMASSRPGAGASPLNELHMRLTYRTVRVLGALAANPGSSNRRVGDASGISDQGQVSKLLSRLQQLGLIENTSSGGPVRGEPNAWTLTRKGWDVQRALAAQPTAS
jgi:AcrR family transcriptional regulator